MDELEAAAVQGLALAEAAEDVEEAEVFVAENGTLLTRLNFTSHIPSNGVEEPKSMSNLGVGVRAVFTRDGGQRLIGFGSEPSDIGAEGVRSALEKARDAAVADPEFVSLPKAAGAPAIAGPYHDPRVLGLRQVDLVDAGWSVLEGALDVFESSEDLLGAAGSRERLRELGLIVGGDVTMLQERMAIATTQMPAVQSDASTLAMAFITAMIESESAKGGGWAAGTGLDVDFAAAGREAAEGAILAMGGGRVEGGAYDVILGPYAVTDILNHLVLPVLGLELFYAGATPFLGKLGKQVAAAGLSIYDDGAAPGLAATKRITCEGLPTGRTDLIRDGVLVGLLANQYEAERMLRDPKAAEKLGAPPEQHLAGLAPRSGFRFARGGGRHFDATPGVSPTNVIVEAENGVSLEELAQRVGDGLYIGRIWYTYPINGISAGDFTCTVIGDSFVIRNGRLAEPIKANTLRINDSIHHVLERVIGVGAERRGTMVWAADQIVYAPEIAVRGLQIEEIAHYLDGA